MHKYTNRFIMEDACPSGLIHWPCGRWSSSTEMCGHPQQKCREGRRGSEKKLPSGHHPWLSGESTIIGWWFGTCLFFHKLGIIIPDYFSIYWEFHHPNWRSHIFQDGYRTTNQIMYHLHRWIIFPCKCPFPLGLLPFFPCQPCLMTPEALGSPSKCHSAIVARAVLTERYPNRP